VTAKARRTAKQIQIAAPRPLFVIPPRHRHLRKMLLQCLVARR
jgi:hypothetical protein